MMTAGERRRVATSSIVAHRHQSVTVLRARILGVACALLLSVSCGAVSGEDPKPLLGALQNEPALQLTPPSARKTNVRTGTDSGTVVVATSFADAGTPDAVFEWYGKMLPPLGWRPDEPGKFQEGQRWLKRISGKQVMFDVIPRPPEGSIEVSVFLVYATGLIGG